MKPGPKAHPARRLMDAAVDFAMALEVENDHQSEAWDRLRKAAMAYRKAPKSRGRPGRVP
jgi:hypothetical protein